MDEIGALAATEHGDPVDKYLGERSLFRGQFIGQFIVGQVLLESVKRDAGIFDRKNRTGLPFEFISEPCSLGHQHGDYTARVAFLRKDLESKGLHEEK
jgi:hypothetical protein